MTWLPTASCPTVTASNVVGTLPSKGLQKSGFGEHHCQGSQKAVPTDCQNDSQLVLHFHVLRSLQNAARAHCVEMPVACVPAFQTRQSHKWLEVQKSQLKNAGLSLFVAQRFVVGEVVGLRMGGAKGDPECGMSRQGKSVKCCS